MAATDKEKTLEKIISTTESAKDEATGLTAKTDQTRYYGLNVTWADPAKQKLVEVIAITTPQTGQQALAAFVANIMHDLRAPEIYSDLITASRDLREQAAGRPVASGFGAMMGGKTAGGKKPAAAAPTAPQCVIS